MGWEKLLLLSDFDESQYARLAGRDGGQALSGGLDTPDTLTLRPYPAAAAGILVLADASPHAALTGNLDVSGKVEAGSAPYALGESLLNVGGSSSLSPALAMYGYITGHSPSDSQFTVGLYGGASQQGTPAFGFCYGLYFFAQHNTASILAGLAAIYTMIQSGEGASGSLTIARNLHLAAATWLGSKPTTVRGIDIEQQGGSGAGTAEGLKIADQTATTVRLLELGPATPYLRLVGGANPAANQTNLYLKEQSTLRQVQWKDGASIGAGDRVMILV